jgi:hypothetical protein
MVLRFGTLMISLRAYCRMIMRVTTKTTTKGTRMEPRRGAPILPTDLSPLAERAMATETGMGMEMGLAKAEALLARTNAVLQTPDMGLKSTIL